MNEQQPVFNHQQETRHFFGFRFLFILLFLFILVFFSAYFFYNLQPLKIDSGEFKEFRINKNEGLRKIGAKLSQENLIRSIFVFKLYSVLSGKAHKFKPGFYDLSPSMSLIEIVRILTEGEVKTVKVTIPEGYAVKDIENLLINKRILLNDGFQNVRVESFVERFPFLSGVDSWEGLLFPDTYKFNLEMKPEEVLEKFLVNFEKKAWSLLKVDEKKWYFNLILASLLEKEVPDFSDRQLVAGILLKRLKVNMPLQVDATIVYAKCNKAFIGCTYQVVKKADLTIVSEYNTYQKLGLTPTPITNPSQSAIQAALNPQESPYWYYLSDSKTKETIFSKTLQEHNLKRLKHL